MAIDDWCDVAWAYILRTTPMMANPHEYRATLWSILYEGEAPPPKSKTEGKSGSRSGASRSRSGMTNRDRVKLADFMGQIDQLKQERDPG